MSPPKKPLSPKDTLPDFEDEDDEELDEDLSALGDTDDEPTVVKKREH